MKLLFLPITLWLDWVEAWLTWHERRFVVDPEPPPDAEIIDLAEERRRRAA